MEIAVAESLKHRCTSAYTKWKQGAGVNQVSDEQVNFKKETLFNLVQAG